MNQDVAKAVKEAILAAKGDRDGAIRVLKMLVDRDDKLFRAFMEPYVQGILFQQVDETLKRVKARKAGEPVPATAPGAAPAPAAAAKPAEPAKKAPKVQELKPAKEGILDQIVDRLAQNIPAPPTPPKRAPRTAQEALASLGRDPNGPPPPKATQRHQNALQAVAKSFKKF